MSVEITGTEKPDELLGDFRNNTIHGLAGSDTIFGGGRTDLIYGDEGNDRIYGERGDDTIFAGQGRDLINGGAGDDSLFGGTQSDVFDGGLGFDVVSYEFLDTGRGVVATLSGARGEGRADVFTRVEGVVGSPFDDILRGGDGALLAGMSGDDTLVASGGADTLAGGTGADVYRFTANSASGTVIQVLTDEAVINLKRIDADLTDSGPDARNQAFEFIGEDAEFTAAGQLSWKAIGDGTGAILVSAEMTGDGIADLTFRIDFSWASISADTFVL
ncbi:calcium-binding protein [Hansschlegelia zhihuaiae]|uniref:Calcium-binding protein n=1 Tax=Hansschlegelia zhihuaiae TaxID=405005 RepID=A0A4Q0MJ51_9HYPH|nr:calcium-binding protein [Hansschlegelia zhihuaiae]RXF72976.1 calcium-binding protein [Hansschlegelia zhihuaiae]